VYAPFSLYDTVRATPARTLRLERQFINLSTIVILKERPQLVS